MDTVTTPHYGHQPIMMNRIADEEPLVNVGDFSWMVDIHVQRYIIVALPKQVPGALVQWIYNCLPVHFGENSSPMSWGWNGNEDKPTLTPSIHAIGHWHGWIRNGVLIEA